MDSGSTVVEEAFECGKAYKRHPAADTQGIYQLARYGYLMDLGGIFIRDEENVTGVIFDVVKSMGKKVMEGSVVDIMSVSRPALISHHITYLEAIA
jgi:hypothetical protein